MNECSAKGRSKVWAIRCLVNKHIPRQKQWSKVYNELASLPSSHPASVTHNIQMLIVGGPHGGGGNHVAQETKKWRIIIRVATFQVALEDQLLLQITSTQPKSVPLEKLASWRQDSMAL